MSDLVVRGGAGGTAARLDDLAAAAALLRSCGGDLLRVGAALLAVGADPLLQATTLVSPLTALAADGALAAATVGPRGVGAVGARLMALGCAVGAVERLYAATDAVCTEAVHQADLAAGRVVGTALAPFTPVLVGSAAVAGAAAPQLDPDGRLAGRAGDIAMSVMGRYGDVTEHVVDALPGVVTGVLGPSLGAGVAWSGAAGTRWPPGDIAAGARLVGAAGFAVPALRDGGSVRVTMGPVRPAVPLRGMAELTERIVGCTPAAGAGPGTVRVEAVVGADGRRAWVVSIPGMQTMSGGGNPFDLAGSVHGMAGEQTAAHATVLQAMHAAGVRHGEPVLLAGHSLGGIVAAGLASDARFRSQFDVTHVLTVGSPIGGFPIPDRVQVLAIEHSDDPVPRLDGRPNPDRPGWVTVQRTLTPPASAVSGVVAHELGGYSQTAALVEASRHPSVEAWRAGLTPFLDRPGATAWAVDVRGERSGVAVAP